MKWFTVALLYLFVILLHACTSAMQYTIGSSFRSSLSMSCCSVLSVLLYTVQCYSYKSKSQEQRLDSKDLCSNPSVVAHILAINTVFFSAFCSKLILMCSKKHTFCIDSTINAFLIWRPVTCSNHRLIDFWESTFCLDVVWKCLSKIT